jgi:large subunit ribosomal protein L9
MQVILREDVTHLGEVGDIVTVKAGFARNFLLPQGKAVVAGERQVKRLEHEKRIIERRVAKARGAAQGEASKLNGVRLVFERAVGENEKLFGSVTSMDIEAMLKEKGFDVSRKQIQLADTIKALGDFDVGVKLHRDVVASIKVSVEPKTEAEG